MNRRKPLITKAAKLSRKNGNKAVEPSVLWDISAVLNAKKETRTTNPNQ